MSKLDSELPSPTVRSELCRAESLERQSQWPAADISYRTAVELDHSPASRIAFGASLAARERYNEAICQLTDAMDQAASTGNYEALGVIFHNLAAIYRELGDRVLARRFQQRAIQHLEDCGMPELIGLANDAWLAGRTELAICLASACADDVDDQEQDEFDQETASLSARATLSVLSGLTENPRDGIRSLIAIYRKHQAAGDQRLMGIDLLNLAVLLSEVGRHQAEIRLVHRAVQHFEQASAPVSAAKARRIQALLQRAQSLREFNPSLN